MICWIKCVTGSYRAPTDADCSAIRNICCNATGEVLAGSESAQAQPKSTGSVLGTKLEITFPGKEYNAQCQKHCKAVLQNSFLLLRCVAH